MKLFDKALRAYMLSKKLFDEGDYFGCYDAIAKFLDTISDFKAYLLKSGKYTEEAGRTVDIVEAGGIRLLNDVLYVIMVKEN